MRRNFDTAGALASGFVTRVGERDDLDSETNVIGGTKPPSDLV